jgi:hypothetical protein
MDKIQKVEVVLVRDTAIALYLGRKKQTKIFKAIFASELHLYGHKHIKKFLKILTEVECLVILTNG